MVPTEENIQRGSQFTVPCIDGLICGQVNRVDRLFYDCHVSGIMRYVLDYCLSAHLSQMQHVLLYTSEFLSGGAQYCSLTLSSGLVWLRSPYQAQ